MKWECKIIFHFLSTVQIASLPYWTFLYVFVIRYNTIGLPYIIVFLLSISGHYFAAFFVHFTCWCFWSYSQQNIYPDDIARRSYAARSCRVQNNCGCMMGQWRLTVAPRCSQCWLCPALACLDNLPKPHLRLLLSITRCDHCIFSCYCSALFCSQSQQFMRIFQHLEKECSPSLFTFNPFILDN